MKAGGVIYRLYIISVTVNVVVHLAKKASSTGSQMKFVVGARVLAIESLAEYQQGREMQVN